MYAAKCLTLLVVLVGLALMLVLYRRKTHQILLAIALSIFVGGALRLFQIQDNRQTLYTVGAICLAMTAVWLISWLSNRAAFRRRSSGNRPRP